MLHPDPPVAGTCLRDPVRRHRPLGPDTTDMIYNRIEDCLGRPEFRPCALFERFNMLEAGDCDAPVLLYRG
jgi:glucuronate isomerase